MSVEMRLAECLKYAAEICDDCEHRGRPTFHIGSSRFTHFKVGRNGEDRDCDANSIWKCFERMFGRL
jgi:hypothetical protein